MWSVKCGVGSVHCEVRSGDCEVQILQYEVVLGSFVGRVDRNSGKSFVQVLWYEVVFKPATHVFQNHAKFMSD